MKTILSLIAVAILSGCAAGPTRMKLEDVDNLQFTCANRDAQIRFLEQQLPTSGERAGAALSLNMFSELWAHMNGEKTYARSMTDREYGATIRNKIWDLRTYCKAGA